MIVLYGENDEDNAKIMTKKLEAIQKLYPNDDKHLENVAILSFGQFLSYLSINPSIQAIQMFKDQQLAIDAIKKHPEFKVLMKESRLAFRALNALTTGRGGQTNTLGNPNSP